MKIKKFEAVIILITLACACLTIGFFIGRSHGTKEVTVQVESTADPGETLGVNKSQLAAAEATSTPQPTAAPTAAPQAPSPSAEAAAAPSQEQTPEETDTIEGKININTASAEELESLDGIGEVLAQRIVDYRNEHGAFTSIEQIMNVSGIGEGRFGNIKDDITV